MKSLATKASARPKEPVSIFGLRSVLVPLLSFARAVEENLKHGIVLTKSERQKALRHLLLVDGRTQVQVGKIFGVKQQTVSNWVQEDKTLISQLNSKTNVSVLNELLNDVKQQEIADSYGITQGRVAQIKSEFLDKLNVELDSGLIFSEIVKAHPKLEKLDDLLYDFFEESKDILSLLKGVETRDLIGKEFGVSGRTVDRYLQYAEIVEEKPEFRGEKLTKVLREVKKEKQLHELHELVAEHLILTEKQGT